MGIKKNTSNLHWNYFLALESDMESIARYIEFDEANYDTYSIELARLLFAASSEVEIVAKDLCDILGVSLPKIATIKDWRKGLKSVIPHLSKESVFIPKYGLTLDTPFEKFSKNSTPDWWNSYNAVKHSRHDKFSQATLKNALLALAGLFIIIMYHKSAEIGASLTSRNRAIVELQPESVLFRFRADYYITPKFVP